MLSANAIVWAFTMTGASLLAITLVSLGVGMGAWAPSFNAENPLQVGLSLGGFAYMAISLGYVGAMMLLMARPVVKAAFQASRPEDVPGLVAEAFRVMRAGRPGPVLLDLPKDVLMGTATVDGLPLAEAPTPVTSPGLGASLDRVGGLLDRAARPVLKGCA